MYVCTRASVRAVVVLSWSSSVVLVSCLCRVTSNGRAVLVGDTVVVNVVLRAGHEGRRHRDVAGVCLLQRSL